MRANILITHLNVLGNDLNLIEKPYTAWRAEDAAEAVEKMKASLKKGNLTRHMQAFQSFNSYLLEKELIPDNPLNPIFTATRRFLPQFAV